MRSAIFDRKQTHVLRLLKGEDLLGELTEYCNREGIDAGEVRVIGAVQNANLGFYDQEKQEYTEHFVDEPMEVLQGSGNISYLEGERFVHMHATFSDENHEVIAGHLFEGTTVFAIEAVLQELEGPRLNRVQDPDTGLTLWDL